MSDFAEVPLLVAFTNLNGYTAQIAGLEDLEVARVMAAFYELAGETISAAGGRVVKFIGDAMLAVFTDADSGVLCILSLKNAADEFMDRRNWECRLVARVHFGPVAEGHFGSAQDRRYDILGKTVNVTARLDSSGVALTAEAFRRLSPDMRQRFKKHTPPITYIRREDAHRPRWAKAH